MAKSPVLTASFGLFAVWWGISLVAYLVTGRIWSGEDWVEATLQAWSSLLGGAVLGLGATAAVVLGARQWRIARLIGDNVRGVVCSIGPLPVNFDRPQAAEAMPEAEGLRLPGPDFDLDGKIDRFWMQKWFEKYENFFPEHAALMRAVARVLNSKPNLPAACKKLAKGVRRYQYGFDEHMHGNHTLVEHSWVCASVGIWLAEHGYEYKGLQFQNRDKKDVGFVPRKDQQYKFKAFDPLIGLICFAHDIGKIETFRMNDEGNVEVIEPAHDSVGARMLARMDEFWALPFEDRMTLTLAIGHYHKPSKIPLRRDEEAPNKAEALSDRTMAMLRLVILADEEAGAIENKKSVLNGENQPREIKEEEYRVDLWMAFKDLLSESQRIHNEPSRYRIGQKNTTPAGTLITLKEGDLRQALLEKMELRKSVKESITARGSVQITEDLLEVLDAKGCLVKEVGGVSVSAKDAIWKVEFLGKDKSRAGEVIASWPYAILINPEEHFPKLANGPEAQSMPRVVQLADRTAMAEERKARKQSGMNALTQAPLVDANGVFIIPDGTKDRKSKSQKTEKPQVSSNAENKAPSRKENIVDFDSARQEKSKQTTATQSLESPAPLKSSTDNAEDKPPVVGDQVVKSSTADFLDEADPIKSPGKSVKQLGDQPVKAEEGNGAMPEGEEAPAESGQAVVNIVQKLLKDKVKEAVSGEDAKQATQEEKSEATGEASQLPRDVIALTDSMRSTLIKIEVAASSGKLAGEVLPDGRKGYSLEALSATLPNFREKLQDLELVRKLMAAARLGSQVPVCMTRKTEGGVILLIVNEAALRKTKHRG